MTFEKAAESLKAEIQRGHHVGGQQFTLHDDRTFQRVHAHDCGWEGVADVYQCVSFETFRCGGCGVDVTVWDELDLVRDGGEVDPHTDPDFLDGPPERFGPREVAS